MSILQVNAFEKCGGAEIVVRNLLRQYRRKGLDAHLAVGQNLSGDPDALIIPRKPSRGLWYQFWRRLERQLSWLGEYKLGLRRLPRLAGQLAAPAKMLDTLRGIESFRYPGTLRLLDLPPQRPDILHAHNLHSNYFDLRALIWLSMKVPLVLTLHDAWLISGHCAQSFECNRWKTGCGHCPDLSIYPPIRRDMTAYNWARKQAIYSKCRLNIATPSSWLMNRVEQSILTPAIIDARVIPNGIDLSIFKPGDRHAARQELGIPQEARVLLFAAYRVRKNPFKDYRTIRDAVAIVAQQLNGCTLLLIALGETAEPEWIGKTQIRFVSFEPDPTVVAKYYQAADIYLHAARADTFPTTVLEALACATPVVATAVGGIPEQIKGLDLPEAARQFSKNDTSEATGVLVNPGDAEGMARSVVALLEKIDLMSRIADNAVKDAIRRFDLTHQCDAYLSWYETILERWNTNELIPNCPMTGDV